MKLSDICRLYYLTDALYKSPVDCALQTDGRIELSYTHEGQRHACTTDDTDVTSTNFGTFVVSCDGMPWEFIAWEKVRL